MVENPNPSGLAQQERPIAQSAPDQMQEHRDEIRKNRFKNKIGRYTRPLLRPFNRSRDDAEDKPRVPLKTKLRKGLVAATAIATFGGGMALAHDTTEQPGGTELIVTDQARSPQQTTPEQATPPEQQRPTSAVSAETRVQEGSSLWKTIRHDVSDIDSGHKRGVTSVATKFAAFENSLADANDIRPGNYKVLDHDSLLIISDALDNPPGRHATEEDKDFADNVKAWAESGIPYDKLVQDEEQQQRFQEMLDYLQAQRQRSMH